MSHYFIPSVFIYLKLDFVVGKWYALRNTKGRGGGQKKIVTSNAFKDKNPMSKTSELEEYGRRRLAESPLKVNKVFSLATSQPKPDSQCSQTRTEERPKE